MPERLTPGVYIEEVSGGVKPIQGVGTSTAGFIGEAARGIPDRATFLAGFRDYERQFGGHRRGEGGFLAQAVQAFFDAGGRRAYVVRVLPQNAEASRSMPVNSRGNDEWGINRQVLLFTAKGRGNWSAHLRIHIEPSTAFQDVAFRVRVEWMEGGRARTVENFDNVRLDPQHEDYVFDLINKTSKYIEVTDLFTTEFLDAEERTLPLLPEIVAGLEVSPGDDGIYEIPLKAKFQFTWNDATSSGGIDPAQPRQVEITAQAVTAVGGSITDGIAQLNAVQLQDLFDAALNPSQTNRDFRVTIPVGPASLMSEEGPFDVSGAPVNTTGFPRMRFAVDGVDQPETTAFQAMTPAESNLGSATAPLDTADVLALTINGVAHSYTLAAGEVTAGAATVQELVNVINREFPAIRAYADAGGDLILRTDQVGPTATLQWDFGGAVTGQTRGAGNVANLTRVTAPEVAAIFNSTSGMPFEARVDGNRVEFIQTDLTDTHRIQWTSPTTIVTDTTEHTGPVTPGTANVGIEPLVASKAYLSVQLPQGRTTLDVSGNSTITLTVRSGNDTDNYVIDVSGDNNLTLADLADRLNEATPDQISADAAGTYLVVQSEAQGAGVSLRLAADPAPAPWRSLRSLAGKDGLVVEAQHTVTIKVSEVLQIGVPRVLGSLFTRVSATGIEENASANPILRPAETGDAPVRLLGGSDGSGLVGLAQYQGSATKRSGMRAFDVVDINMLVIPGKNDPGYLSSAMAYCDQRDVFFIADGPGNIDRQFEMSSDEVRQFVEGLPARSNNAAMFYPWVEVVDPVGIGRNPRRFVPPSGHMAGVFARTDLSRGVWKAPAGIQAVVSGAMDLQHNLVDADQDLLNPIGLNCIRTFPNTGIVVWGSRTLASDPEWRYVPVRRTALFLKESLRRGLKWAVFEPNDQELWDRIRVNIDAFMLGLFRQGAFQGATPDEAFLVKCDRETNPQELIDQGIVTAQVAFAPLKPAEFVVIEISQKALIG